MQMLLRPCCDERRITRHSWTCRCNLRCLDSCCLPWGGEGAHSLRLVPAANAVAASLVERTEHGFVTALMRPTRSVSPRGWPGSQQTGACCPALVSLLMCCLR